MSCFAVVTRSKGAAVAIRAVRTKRASWQACAVAVRPDVTCKACGGSLVIDVRPQVTPRAVGGAKRIAKVACLAVVTRGETAAVSVRAISTQRAHSQRSAVAVRPDGTGQACAGSLMIHVCSQITYGAV